MQRLAVSGDDEEGVVDPDADADHRGDLRREVRRAEDVGQHTDARGRDADADERGHDRKSHGDQRTEGDQQHDDRGEDAHHFTRRKVDVVEPLAAELHVDSLRLERACASP